MLSGNISGNYQQTRLWIFKIKIGFYRKYRRLIFAWIDLVASYFDDVLSPRIWNTLRRFHRLSLEMCSSSGNGKVLMEYLIHETFWSDGVDFLLDSPSAPPASKFSFPNSSLSLVAYLCDMRSATPLIAGRRLSVKSKSFEHSTIC